MTPPDIPPPTEIQLRFARVLEWTMHLGLAMLALSFTAYCAGWLPPMVPLDAMPALWGHPLADYLQRAGLPIGWGWVKFAAHGDVANLAGIAVLAGATVAGLLAVVPLYIARKDRIYAALALVGAAVVLLAASAVLSH